MSTEPEQSVTAAAPRSEASEEQILARDMIEVHGDEAAAIARGNARQAAIAGQAIKARSWIRVVAAIQRRQSAARAQP